MALLSTRLRDLRMTAVPRLSVRAMAAALDLPLGTYSNYESSRYKKATIPLDLTRRIAAILARHGVDPSEVMKLAGLVEGEAEPEARAIEAAKPQVQFVTCTMVFPSEDALADMFSSLLALIPPEASRAEAARILAQRLPAGFAAIGPVAPDQGRVSMPAADEVVQFLATDHPELPRS